MKSIFQILICNFLFLILFSLDIHHVRNFSAVYPLCSKTEISYGRYESLFAPLTQSISYDEIDRHFVYGGPGEAVNFTQIWLPYNCSDHRFTNHTLQNCAKVVQQHHNKHHPHHRVDTGRLDIVFIGDSATRSIFCGLTRILSGSELYGPCSNKVCGKEGAAPISYRETFLRFEEDFPPNLRFYFMYFRSLTNTGADTHLYNSIRQLKPYAIIFNTGAWDFDEISRHRPKDVRKTEYCNGTEEETVSLSRVSLTAQAIFSNMSILAKEYHTRLIYRTNHYNNRYGVHCADDRVIQMLQHLPTQNLGAVWEIWDNRNLSYEVWQEQNYDGFHFDRNRVNSYEHHIGHVQFFKKKNWILPGKNNNNNFNLLFYIIISYYYNYVIGILEVSLAQSLLHWLFHSCVGKYYKLEFLGRQQQQQSALLSDNNNHNNNHMNHNNQSSPILLSES
jgi:hypothetical protein